MPRTFEGGGGISGPNTDLTVDVSQTAHGFSVGDVIRSDGTANSYTLAQADSPANAEAVGMVTNIINANNFSYTSAAVQLSGVFVPVAIPGTAIFLDPAIAGGMTLAKPTAIGQVVRALGTVLTSGSLMYFDVAALGEELTSVGAGGSARTFQSTGGGTGGGTLTASFVAGEAINGAIDPKAVFAGTTFDPTDGDGRNSTGGIVTTIFDVYDPGSNASHSIDWSSKMFAYKLTGGKTFNEIEFEGWNNNMSVTINVDFYNTGTTTPTGVPFYSTVISYTEPGGGGSDTNNYYLNGDADCTATLGGGNNYWLVLTFGVGSTTVDLQPHVGGAAPDFLEWNGLAWVTPFSSPGRSPGVALSLAPTFGNVYHSLGGDTLDDSNSGKMDEWLWGRQRFIGFVNTNVVQGGTAVVILDGNVNFTTDLLDQSNRPSNFQLDTSLGVIEFYNSPAITLKVGTAVDITTLHINRNSSVLPVEGAYQ